MDAQFSEFFVSKWRKYFADAELPLAYFYTDQVRDEDLADEPLAVIFFAGPDVLAGLFTLANFDLAEAQGVIAPFGSGCAAIVEYPYLEIGADQPKCILGMFDVTTRPFVPANTLTFTIPMKRFEQMVRNMDESFLITGSWEAVRARL